MRFDYKINRDQGGTVKTLLFVLLLILFAHPVCAQEFYVHAGNIHLKESHSNSMGYGVSYFQKTSEHTLVSLSYINQGHFLGHHRDGLAPQVWWRQMLGRHFSLSAGIGPFAYFDTTGPHDASLDNHGVGGMLSAAATWHTFSPFLVQLRTNWVKSAHSIDTFSATIALGYQLDVSRAPTPSLLADGKDLKNEATFFVGQTVLNQFRTASAAAGAIEYRRNLTRNLDWTFTALYEGDVIPIHRFGPATQLWLVQNFYGDRLSLGVGAGPYLVFDKTEHKTETILTGPVITLTGAYRLSPHWGLRVSWNRVTTSFSHDTDVFMGGVSYRF
jgi:hypothetical protein